jgi:hypothetical protein
MIIPKHYSHYNKGSQPKSGLTFTGINRSSEKSSLNDDFNDEGKTNLSSSKNGLDGSAAMGYCGGSSQSIMNHCLGINPKKMINRGAKITRGNRMINRISGLLV